MVRYTINRYRAAYAGLPRELWVLALVLFINRSGAMVLAFLTLYLTSEIHMSEGAAGQMISLYGVGAIAGSYLGGRLAEAVGAVRMQTLCMFAAVPVYMAIPIWSSPWAIGVCIFLLSLANEAVRPASATAIAKLARPQDRLRAFALQRLAANLGFSFGPAIGGLLASINFTLLFVVDGLTTFASACVLLYFFGMRRLPGEAPKSHDRAMAASPLADRAFVVFLGLILLSSLVFFQFIATYPLYLRDHFELTKRQIGLLFAVNTVVIVLFEMLLIDSVKRWPLLRTIGWGCFLSCLGFGLLPFGVTFSYAVLAMLVLTLGEMLSMPLATGYVANRAPEGSEGRYMGWWAMTLSLAFVLGPAAGGAIYAVDRDLVWLASGAIAFLVLVGFYLLPQSAGDVNTGEAISDSDPVPEAPVAPHIPSADPAELCTDSVGS